MNTESRVATSCKITSSTVAITRVSTVILNVANTHTNVINTLISEISHRHDHAPTFAPSDAHPTSCA